MQNKRVVIVALSVLLVSICGVGFAIAYSDNPWNWLGKEHAKIDNLKGTDEIVAYINGEAVSKGELIFWQKMTEFGNKTSGTDEPTDAKTVFYEHVLPSKVVANAAKKQNLWPNDQETKEYIAEVRYQFELLDEAKEQLKSYITGLGLSEDEYFEEYAFEYYRRGLANGKYREKIAQQFDGKLPHEVMAQVEAHLENLKSQAQIEIVHPLLQQ